MCPFILCDTAAKFCCHTNCFGNIHRRSSTKCHDKICSGFFKCLCSLFNSRHGRVGLYIRKDIHFHTSFFQIISRFVHNSHFSQCRAGNQHGMGTTQFFCTFRKFCHRSCTYHNILWNKKFKCFHN